MNQYWVIHEYDIVWRCMTVLLRTAVLCARLYYLTVSIPESSSGLGRATCLTQLPPQPTFTWLSIAKLHENSWSKQPPEEWNNMEQSHSLCVSFDSLDSTGTHWPCPISPCQRFQSSFRHLRPNVDTAMQNRHVQELNPRRWPPQTENGQ